MNRRLLQIATTAIALTACLDLPEGSISFFGPVPPLVSTGTVSVGGVPVEGATVQRIQFDTVVVEEVLTNSAGVYEIRIEGEANYLCAVTVNEIWVRAKLEDGRQSAIRSLNENVPSDCVQSLTIVKDFPFSAPE